MAGADSAVNGAAGGQSAGPDSADSAKNADGAKDAEVTPSSIDLPADDMAALEKVYELMEGNKMDEASTRLGLVIDKHPNNQMLLHNLGVIRTEQGRFEDAEHHFQEAWDLQKREGKINWATIYGLAKSLTEQGGETQKLMKAEALWRDYLDRAISMEEKGIMDTFRAFNGLAQNFEKQKRWADVVQARASAYQLAERMFGDNASFKDALAEQAALLARAETLAKYQKYVRRLMWSVTVAIPVGVAYWYNRSGADTGPAVLP